MSDFCGATFICVALACYCKYLAERWRASGGSLQRILYDKYFQCCCAVRRCFSISGLDSAMHSYCNSVNCSCSCSDKVTQHRYHLSQSFRQGEDKSC